MNIGKIFGVSFRLNTFFLVLLFLYITFGVLPKGLVAFGVVLLHEMAHVLVARSYGLVVREVEILPFGGVARLEGNIGLDPAVEAYIAVAGPLTNLFLILLAWFMWAQGYWNDALTPYFIKCNLLIGLFNLLPALPLDGGRIYRALLARRVGLKKATARAAFLGRVLGVFFIASGLVGWLLSYNTVNMIIVALFLFYAAGKEGKQAMFVFLKHLTRKKEELAKSGMLPANHYVATAVMPLKKVLSNIVPNKFYLVYVLDENFHIKKILTEGELIKAMLEKGIEATVGEI